MDEFVAVCQSNNPQQLEKMVRGVIMAGYSGSQLLSQVGGGVVVWCVVLCGVVYIVVITRI